MTRERGGAGDAPARDGPEDAAAVRVAEVVGAEVSVVARERGARRARAARAAVADGAGVPVAARCSVRLERAAHAGAAGGVAEGVGVARDRRGGTRAGARARAPARLAGVAVRARVLVVAGGPVRLGGAAGIARVVADRPEERRHGVPAVLLEVGGETLHLAVRIVGRLEHYEAPGEHGAASAFAVDVEARCARRLERPARGALVGAGHERGVHRRGEVGGPEVAGRVAAEVDVHAVVEVPAGREGAVGGRDEAASTLANVVTGLAVEEEQRTGLSRTRQAQAGRQDRPPHPLPPTPRASGEIVEAERVGRKDLVA